MQGKLSWALRELVAPLTLAKVNRLLRRGSRLREVLPVPPEEKTMRMHNFCRALMHVAPWALPVSSRALLIRECLACL